MEVKIKGEPFTKILLDNQRNLSPPPPSQSILRDTTNQSELRFEGQAVKLVCSIGENMGRGPCIYVDKGLLVANSQFLKRLLQEDFSDCPTIIIPDFDISTVEKFCRLLYQGLTMVSAGEIEIIRKLAELLGFQIPTLSDPTIEGVNSSKVLRYFDSHEQTSSTESTDRQIHEVGSTSRISIPLVVEPLEVNKLKTEQKALKRKEYSGISFYEPNKGADKSSEVQLKKCQVDLLTIEHNSSQSTTTPSTSATHGTTARRPDRKEPITASTSKLSPTPSTSGSSHRSRRTRTQRVDSFLKLPDFESAVSEDWNRFIKCYFCSDSFDSEQDLSSHLARSCGKHLTGHLSFDTKFCNFCNSTSESLTQWGYVKHVDLCYQKSLKTPATSSNSQNEAMSTTTAPLAGNEANAPLSTSEVDSADSDGSSEEVSEGEILSFEKQLRIEGALMTVRQFRELRSKYERDKDRRVKRVRLTKESINETMSPSNASNPSTSNSNQVWQWQNYNPDLAKAKDNIPVKNHKQHQGQGQDAHNSSPASRTCHLPNPCTVAARSIIPPKSQRTIHDYFTSSTSEASEVPVVCKIEPCDDNHNSEEAEASNSEHFNVNAANADEATGGGESMIDIDHEVKVDVTTINTAPIVSVREFTQQSSLNDVPRSETPSRVRRKSGAHRSRRKLAGTEMADELMPTVLEMLARKSPADQEKHMRMIEEQEWNPLLIEAIGRICKQNQRSNLSTIYNVVHCLAKTKSETFKTQLIKLAVRGGKEANSLPINQVSMPFEHVREADVLRRLNEAVKNGLLHGTAKEGQLCYLISERSQAEPTLGLSSALGEPVQSTSREDHNRHSMGTSSSETRRNESSSVSPISPESNRVRSLLMQMLLERGSSTGPSGTSRSTIPTTVGDVVYQAVENVYVNNLTQQVQDQGTRISPPSTAMHVMNRQSSNSNATSMLPQSVPPNWNSSPQPPVIPTAIQSSRTTVIRTGSQEISRPSPASNEGLDIQPILCLCRTCGMSYQDPQLLLSHICR